ncbi:peptidyl-prolyl cis-trans isomerase [Candidatus Galacturonibacter soehngenii]|nr:peptidyl-prolyl cis-trans isomerase [Candidatus Galacturonibacter soehngenii]
MKKNVSKKIVGIATTLLACASMITGCAGSVNLNTPVAVVNDENVSFGVAKFYAKTQQVMYESYYGSLFGDNMWDQTLSADMTFGESTLENILEEIKEMYIVNQHADEYEITLSDEEKSKIEETAKQFMADNNADAIESMGASEEVIIEYLTKFTLQGKIEAAIKAGADTNVADEDAAQRTFSYVLVSTAGTTDETGKTVDLTDEEKAAKKEEAQAIIDAVAGGKDFDTAVTDTERSVSTASYGKDDDAGMNEAVIAAADALQEGEISPIVETDGGYYVLKLTSAFDQEQTENRRQEIITQRQTTLYEDTYTKWKDASKVSVDNKVWKKITFKDKLSMVSNATMDDIITEDTTTEDTTADDSTTNQQTIEDTTKE